MPKSAKQYSTSNISMRRRMQCGAYLLKSHYIQQDMKFDKHRLVATSCTLDVAAGVPMFGTAMVVVQESTRHSMTPRRTATDASQVFNCLATRL
jgi:hypothetical protein